mmetsp:Transcript_24807/g.78421  ORF Transcript_24807/g.78421 Transcript_24807/m.78421 type:complete len:224 (-) Transcript_24807:401-1072(-)
MPGQGGVDAPPCRGERPTWGQVLCPMSGMQGIRNHHDTVEHPPHRPPLALAHVARRPVKLEHREVVREDRQIEDAQYEASMDLREAEQGPLIHQRPRPVDQWDEGRVGDSPHPKSDILPHVRPAVMLIYDLCLQFPLGGHQTRELLIRKRPPAAKRPLDRQRHAQTRSHRRPCSSQSQLHLVPRGARLPAELQAQHPHLGVHFSEVELVLDQRLHRRSGAYLR